LLDESGPKGISASIRTSPAFDFQTALSRLHLGGGLTIQNSIDQKACERHSRSSRPELAAFANRMNAAQLSHGNLTGGGIDIDRTAAIPRSSTPELKVPGAAAGRAIVLPAVQDCGASGRITGWSNVLVVNAQRAGGQDKRPNCPGNRSPSNTDARAQ
jgi:hypothetical protein